MKVTIVRRSRGGRLAGTLAAASLALAGCGALVDESFQGYRPQSDAGLDAGGSGGGAPGPGTGGEPGTDSGPGGGGSPGSDAAPPDAPVGRPCEPDGRWFD